MAFDKITDEYNIASKVRYVITDNAANMKCAFKVICSYFSDTLTAEVEATADGDMLNSKVNSDADATTDSPPGKCPRLLARYRAHKHLSHSAKDACILVQIHKYFDAIQDTDTNTSLEFWSTNRERFPQLHSLAVKVLSIPASSAPEERVFSKGGLIMRPCARLTQKIVKALVFLKSNMALV